ncbi:hypothetical protein [Umezawaea tangerina]|uniref:hypothetical protein n=1 Tax=Umezawaea tangerina TaxID=84725 RepID=UPI0011B273DF|nr:hypothetical protein [Umezawaea tangerina]
MKTPLENWTKTQSELLGTVELDVDWGVPVEDMRQELRRALEAVELWDGRVCVLQVTDAVNSFVRVRALAQAAEYGGMSNRGGHDADARVFGEGVDGEERGKAFGGSNS